MLDSIPDKIITIPIPESQTRIANLQSGQVDLISKVENVYWPQI